MEITSTHLKRHPDLSTVQLRSIKFKHSNSKLDVNGLPLVDKVTCEILSRLPVKSLMRFKRVCKPWGKLVEKDPYFIDSHGTQLKARPNFFAIIMKPLKDPTLERLKSRAKGRGKKYPYKEFSRSVSLVTADYLYEGKCISVADINGIWKTNVPINVKFCGPLNGLLGFYDYENYFGVRLVNVCTREKTPWMKDEEEESVRAIQFTSCHCQLGFDPTTKEHKVICLRSLKCGVYLSFCEVFTVGGDEWRKIYNLPFRFVDDYKHSIYLNGSIYYSPLNFTQFGIPYDKIVVFDVGPEKFRTITIPHFIIDHPREIHTTVSRPVDLLEVNGQLALLCRINGSIVKLWLYDDVDDECKRKSCWEEVTIELPFIWDEKLSLTFLSAIGENQIILKSGEYYSYNWTKKTFTKMKIRGMPYKGLLEGHKTFVGSLLPVR